MLPGKLGEAPCDRACEGSDSGFSSSQRPGRGGCAHPGVPGRRAMGAGTEGGTLGRVSCDKGGPPVTPAHSAGSSPEWGCGDWVLSGSPRCRGGNRGAGRRRGPRRGPRRVWAWGAAHPARPSPPSGSVYTGGGGHLEPPQGRTARPPQGRGPPARREARSCRHWRNFLEGRSLLRRELAGEGRTAGPSLEQGPGPQGQGPGWGQGGERGPLGRPHPPSHCVWTEGYLGEGSPPTHTPTPPLLWWSRLSAGVRGPPGISGTTGACPLPLSNAPQRLAVPLCGARGPAELGGPSRVWHWGAPKGC